MYWARHEIKDDTIIILNGKIFYPYEKYFIFSFLHYKLFVLPKKIELTYVGVQIQCQDAILEININTSICLDFDHAKQTKNPAFEFKNFWKEVKKQVLENILSQAAEMNAHQFITKKYTPWRGEAAGMRYTWDGKFHFSGQNA